MLITFNNKLVKICLTLCLILLNLTTFVGATNENESLYQLDIEMTDQDGTKLHFDVFKGKPVLIAMFYASCPHVCPLTISTIQKTEDKLNTKTRSALRVILVSLDSENDTPDKLKEVALRHKIDDSRWKLVHVNNSDVRVLAAVLGVKFRELPDGEFNHTTLMTLLNQQGLAVTTSSLLGSVDDALVQEINSL